MKKINHSTLIASAAVALVTTLTVTGTTAADPYPNACPDYAANNELASYEDTFKNVSPVSAHDYEFLEDGRRELIKNSYGGSVAKWYEEFPLSCTELDPKKFAPSKIKTFSAIAGVNKELMDAGRFRCGDIIKLRMIDDTDIDDDDAARVEDGLPGHGRGYAYALVADSDPKRHGITVTPKLLKYIDPRTEGHGSVCHIEWERVDPKLGQHIFEEGNPL
ncbi:hypothetical protein P8605_00475 [Streptomyces sp. T-3]|nr:hypothetical protein [Streptomyces sp. T-3]